MKLILLIAALVFAQATRTSARESRTARDPARLLLHPDRPELQARTALPKLSLHNVGFRPIVTPYL